MESPKQEREQRNSNFINTNFELKIDDFFQHPIIKIQQLTDSIKENTLDFLLSAKCDKKAALRFFKKVLSNRYATPPQVISVDKHASYPATLQLMKVQHLNNIIEAVHRFVKRKVRVKPWFQSFHTTQNMLLKDLVDSIKAHAQKHFTENLFGIAA